MIPERIFLVDAGPYIFRAFFSVPSKVQTPDGRPKNALHGFGGFLLKLIESRRVHHMALAFDRSLNSSFRNDLYADYKRQREEPPPELEAQLRWCEALGAALGIRCFVDSRYEADDLIAALVDSLEEADQELVVVSSDKDLAQLVTERVRLLDFARDELYGPDEVVAKFGVRPSQIVDYLGLAGDPVDNIPGVPGIGKKTAAALLGHFDNLEQALGDLDAVAALPLRGAKSVARRLSEHREIALLSKKLATVAREAPARASAAELKILGPNDDLLDPLAFDLGMEGFAQRARKLWARMPDLVDDHRSGTQ